MPIDKRRLTELNKVFPLNVEPYEQYMQISENPSVIGKINAIIQSLHQIGRISNDVARQWNTVMDWIINNGLEDLTSNFTRQRIDELLVSGEFEKIVSEAILDVGQTVNETLVGYLDILKAKVDIKAYDEFKGELSSILNTINSLVAEKTGGATKVEMDDLSQEVKLALTGGSTAVVGTSAVGTINYQSKSLTVEKTEFLSEGKNLFDKRKITDGYIVNNTTGKLAVNANYNVSGYIPVSPNTTYTRTTDLYLAFYDVERVFISGFSAGSGNLTFTTPSNAHYLRVTNVTAFLDTFQLEIGSRSTAYEAYHVKFKNILLEPTNLPKSTLDVIYDLQGKVSKNDERFVSSRNLFNKATVTVGFIASSSSGNLAANSSYSVSDFIPVEQNTTYTRTSDLYLAFYDENKTFISGITINTGKLTFTTPARTAFLRVSMLTGNVGLFQLEKGSTQTSYVEYGTKLVNVDVGHAHKPLNGKSGVMFGDSILQGATYPEFIARNSGAEIVNAGFGATRLARYDNPTYPYSLLGMTEIADGISSGDWTIMQKSIDAVDALTGKTTYNEIFAKLKAVDWSSVDFISFNYGTNDMMNNSLRLGEPESVDPYEINGALNYIIKKISTKYPRIRIYVISPIFRQVIAGHEGNSDTVAPSVFLYDIAKAFGERAKKYHLPFKDLYNESGINAMTASVHLKDGTHPGDFGNENLNHILYGFFTNN